MSLITLANGPFWVDISDLVTEGTFVEVATGGPATFLPWGPGQPDVGDCVVASTENFFFTDNCTLGIPAVCECEP